MQREIYRHFALFFPILKPQNPEILGNYHRNEENNLIISGQFPA